MGLTGRPASEAETQRILDDAEWRAFRADCEPGEGDNNDVEVVSDNNDSRAFRATILVPTCATGSIVRRGGRGSPHCVSATAC